MNKPPDDDPIPSNNSVHSARRILIIQEISNLLALHSTTYFLANQFTTTINGTLTVKPVMKKGCSEND